MRITADKTLYIVLGIPPGASQAELRAAYLELAKRYHPDSDRGKLYAGRFADVTAAYAVLKDEKRRREYDATLTLLTKPCPACKGEGRTYRTRGFTQRIATVCAECEGRGRVA